MQEGSFRCDANVSIRPLGSTEFGTRTETKNLNSFRFVEKAINFEIERQIDVLESGGEVVQETRLFNTTTGETRTMRTKEEANDYRYFPDPDLLPVAIEADFLAKLRQELPELPDAKQVRFVAEYELAEDMAEQLTAARAMADYFEDVAKACGDAKLAANWVTGDLSAYLNQDGLEIDASPVSSQALAGLLQRIADKTISGKIAKDVFEAMWAGEGEADAIIEAKGLKQITDTAAIEPIIDEVIANNPGQVEQYRAGKDKLMGFFVGQVMKATQGKANPAEVNRLLQEKLKG
ncbi:MAG: Asp-tRNA(Asn)/Glu-tRNA(Gln) amidotransferase subunit GatB, partial [Nevskiales bacterium]